MPCVNKNRKQSDQLIPSISFPVPLIYSLVGETSRASLEILFPTDFCVRALVRNRIFVFCGSRISCVCRPGGE